MSRKPDDRDDSDEIPLPSDAEVNRILSAVIPQTPERLKQRTRATRGQDFASYDAQGAPAKARRADTLDVAGPVIADDTHVDGLQLSENTIQQIEAEREEEAQRNDSTVSVDRPPEKKKEGHGPLFLFAVGTVAIGALVFILWRSTNAVAIPTPIPSIPITVVSSSPPVLPSSSEPTIPSAAPTDSETPAVASAAATSTAPRTGKQPVVAVSTSSGTQPPHLPPSAVSSSRPDIAGSP